MILRFKKKAAQIGYAYLFINDLVAGADQSFNARNLSLALKKSAVDGIVVNVNIISRYLGEVISIKNTCNLLVANYDR